MDTPIFDGPVAEPTPERNGAEVSRSASDAHLRRRYGVTGGLLFIFGGLSAIPGSILLTFDPPAAGYLVIGAALALGLICLVAPWERLSWRWFHLLNIVGIALIALSNAAADRTYAVYYVFPALFAGYVFHSRRAVAIHVALISLALVGPVLYGSEPTHVSAITAFGGLPAVVMVAACVLFLRERLESRERAYRRFAEEAVRISLQLRLRGHARAGNGAPAPDSDPELVRLRYIAAGLEALRHKEHDGGIRPGPIPRTPLPGESP